MILPDWPATTKWLTPEERALAAYRLQADGIAVAGNEQKPSHSNALKMAFGDWRTWMLVVMYMLATGAQTIQYFIPTLVSQVSLSLAFYLSYWFLTDLFQFSWDTPVITLSL